MKTLPSSLLKPLAAFNSNTFIMMLYHIVAGIHIKIGCHKNALTHWGRVTHICVSKLTTIGSDNGLSPGRRQAIIWTNARILFIRTLGTNFSEILGKIHSFSFKKMHLKMSSAKGRLFSLGLNELRGSKFQMNGSDLNKWKEHQNSRPFKGYQTTCLSVPRDLAIVINHVFSFR